MQHENGPPHGLPWLNRLSGLLFLLSRVLNRRGEGTEPRQMCEIKRA